MTNIKAKFIYPNLLKEVEILNVNSVNKFSFNGRIKASIEQLVKYSESSLEWLRTLITIMKESS